MAKSKNITAEDIINALPKLELSDLLSVSKASAKEVSNREEDLNIQAQQLENQMELIRNGGNGK